MSNKLEQTEANYSTIDLWYFKRIFKILKNECSLLQYCVEVHLMENFFSSLLSLSFVCRRAFHKNAMVAAVLARVLFSITGVPAGTESVATLHPPLGRLTLHSVGWDWQLIVLRHLIWFYVIVNYWLYKYLFYILYTKWLWNFESAQTHYPIVIPRKQPQK